MTEQRYPCSTNELLQFMLDLELKVIEVLPAVGRRVIYRPHPMTAEAMVRLMEPNVDRIELASVETVWNKEKMMTFTYPLTTTFGFALCTEVSIVIGDVAGWEWNAEARSPLEGRCAFSPATVDEDVRPQYDQQAERDAICMPRTSHGPSYVERYHSPAATGGVGLHGHRT